MIKKIVVINTNAFGYLKSIYAKGLNFLLSLQKISASFLDFGYFDTKIVGICLQKKGECLRSFLGDLANAYNFSVKNIRNPKLNYYILLSRFK